jgi:DNA repair ATPase RecN
LASKASQHLLISKLNSKSSVTLLNYQGRVDEIARIIGGEKPNTEALSFAKKLI